MEEKESLDSSIHLQRTIADQAMQKHVHPDEGFDFAKIAIQPKLKVSQPGDASEQEADKVADQVMGMRVSSDLIASMETKKEKEEVMHRKCAACNMKEIEENENRDISRKTSNTSAFEENNGVANEINYVRLGSALALDSLTRQFMESRFGYDFSNVRIHTDERAGRSAKSVNALAYTVGNDIVFGEGQYQPSTIEGRRLLAHELAHVAQQTGNTMKLKQIDVDEKVVTPCDISHA